MTEGLRRKVGTELGANHSRVTVGTGDLSPDDADLGATDLLLGGVDVSDTLQPGGIERVVSGQLKWHMSFEEGLLMVGPSPAVDSWSVPSCARPSTLSAPFFRCSSAGAQSRSHSRALSFFLSVPDLAHSSNDAFKDAGSSPFQGRIGPPPCWRHPRSG